MTVWEKALVNMEKGYAKLSSFAANFSVRVKSDITIIRVRMHMDDLRKEIAGEQAAIGGRLREQFQSGTLPSSFELFFKQEDVAAALDKIAKLEKDVKGLEEELNRESAAILSQPPKGGGKAA